jgi:hypothetical protein
MASSLSPAGHHEGESGLVGVRGHRPGSSASSLAQRIAVELEPPGRLTRVRMEFTKVCID